LPVVAAEMDVAAAAAARARRENFILMLGLKFLMLV